MLKEVNSEEFKELAGKGLVLADFFLPPVDHVRCWDLY